MKNLIFKSSFHEKLKMLLLVIGLVVTSLTSPILAWTTYYLKSDNTTWAKDNYNWGFSNGGTTTTYMANGSNMKLWRTDWGDNGWFGVNDGSLSDNGSGIRFEQYQGNVSYSGASGMVCFHMDQETGNNNDHPWVWITRPTWYLKHNWNGSTWSWKALTDNSDGTYYVDAKYGNQTTVNHGDNQTEGGTSGEGWGSITATTVGSPTTGTKCRFVFDASNKTVKITKLVTVTFDMKGHGSAIDSREILYNTKTSQPSNPSETGWTFGGWYSNPGCTTSFNFNSAITANTTIYAKWTENKSSITISAGSHGSITTPSPNSSPYSLGVSTKQAIVAKADVGYYFTGWTCTGTAAVDNASEASTNAKTNGTSGSSGTITANFARTYAFIEGRFHVWNASRSGNWTNTFDSGDWSENSTNIQFTLDDSNHRFYLHTYAKPKELKTQISNHNPYFYVRTSTASNSITGGQSYRPSSGTPITAASTNYAVSTAASDNSLYFNTTDESGYVVLYFNESNVWYTLEQQLSYNNNGGSGSKTPTYHARNTNATAPAANTFSKTGHDFTGWKTGPSSGTSYAAGATVPISSSDVTLYAQWTPSTYTVSYTTASNFTYSTKPTSGTYNSTVTIGVTPSLNYKITAYSAYKTGASGTSVTVSHTAGTNTYTFTQPAYAVTFSATAASYGLTASASPTYEGKTFTLSNTSTLTPEGTKGTNWFVP